MEKIRTYDATAFTTASRSINPTNIFVRRKIVFENEIPTTIPDIEGAKVSGLADRMYETHTAWVDQKLTPLIPYIRTGTEGGSEDHAKEQITKRYKEGLTGLFSILKRKLGQGFDAQDAAVFYTTGFTNMLRTCERFEINPNSALNLAERSYNMSGAELAHILQEYNNIPQAAIDRISESTSAKTRLEMYGKKKEIMTRLLRDERFKNTPEEVVANIATKHNGDTTTFFSQQQIEPSRIRGSRVSRIEGVPILERKNPGWCGMTPLSMILQHYGYSDLTPEKVFEHIYGEYDPILEYADPVRGPNIDILALTAQELTANRATPLVARLFDQDKYQKLREKNPERTPEDVLKAFVLERKIPCMVRTPGHFLLAIGMDLATNRYIFIDSLKNYEIAIGAGEFKTIWAKESQNYNDFHLRSSSNLLLAIYPADKEKRKAPAVL